MPVSYDAIRAVAQRLGRFTQADLAAHLGITPQYAGRRLGDLILDGLVKTPDDPEARVIRGTTGRPRHVYEYVRPVNSPGSPRAKRETPEAEVVARMPRSRGDVVSGKRTRGHRRETERLMREVEAAGATLKKAKHGHKVIKDGRVVASIPTTPSDHRSTKNTRADLKRAGLAA